LFKKTLLAYVLHESEWQAQGLTWNKSLNEYNIFLSRLKSRPKVKQRPRTFDDEEIKKVPNLKRHQTWIEVECLKEEGTLCSYNMDLKFEYNPGI
jgi:hypothetical protein